MNLRRDPLAFAAGLLFAAGLVLGGMTNPAKVLGFLDVTGAWDPSLAFVMGGAIAVFAPGYWLMARRSGSLLGDPLNLPTRSTIDARLLVGAALFGVGWGLAGYCPGPALVSTMSLGRDALIVATAMLVGMAGFSLVEARLRRAAP
ncbi:MAG: YeeE/YedE family protein [Myxococcota bacterium]